MTRASWYQGLPESRFVFHWYCQSRWRRWRALPLAAGATGSGTQQQFQVELKVTPLPVPVPVPVPVAGRVTTGSLNASVQAESLPMGPLNVEPEIG